MGQAGDGAAIMQSQRLQTLDGSTVQPAAAAILAGLHDFVVMGDQE
jgi:hypothetical protein